MYSTVKRHLMAKRWGLFFINPLMGTLKLQSNGPLYSNTVIGTLAVDGWAVTFGTTRRGLGRLRPRPVLSSHSKAKAAEFGLKAKA